VEEAWEPWQKRYGYDRFNTEVLLWAVVVIIILVEIVQISGTKIYK